METLGSLCDKITIVKLKQYHAIDPDTLTSLEKQSGDLSLEIDSFVSKSICGDNTIFVFRSNKIYNSKGYNTPKLKGSLGETISELAAINCELWHTQEKVYDFTSVPANEKDDVIKQLAALNLRRNQCIERIDIVFSELISRRANRV